MSINYEYFKLFYSVASKMSITRAAEELHLSQPTVTKEIRQMESELGVTLFRRHSRGVMLTNEGQMLYDHIKDSMNSLRAAEEEMEILGRLQKGTIRIAFSNLNMLMEFKVICREFIKLHPDITIHSSVIPFHSVEHAITSGNVDIAVSGSHYMDDKDIIGFVKSATSLTHIHLATLPDVCIVSSKLYEKCSDCSHLSQINNYPFLYPIFAAQYYTQLLGRDDYKSSADISLGENSASFRILEKLDYIAIVPQYAFLTYEGPGEFIQLDIKDKMTDIVYYLSYSSANGLGPAAMAFKNFVLEHKPFSSPENK